MQKLLMMAGDEIKLQRGAARHWSIDELVDTLHRCPDDAVLCMGVHYDSSHMRLINQVQVGSLGLELRCHPTGEKQHVSDIIKVCGFRRDMGWPIIPVTIVVHQLDGNISNYPLFMVDETQNPNISGPNITFVL